MKFISNGRTNLVLIPPSPVWKRRIFMKLCKEDLLVNILESIDRILNNLCPSGDMADFPNLQGKLEPPT